MKTTFVVGLAAAVAMNLMACVPGLDLMGCAASDPDVDWHVAPLTFQPAAETETCDAAEGVVLNLTDAQGSSIRVAVLPNVQRGQSLPLTADAPAAGPSLASSSADGTVKVTLTDAEYNELPAGWSTASITIDTLPTHANDSLTGDVSFYFADGRTLDVPFDQMLPTACPVAQND